MSDLRAGLLLLSNMKTPLTTSRARPSAPLFGRSHHMAVPHLVPNPQMTVLGRPGSGKGALARRLVAPAMRSWPVVVIDPSDGYEVRLDEFAGREPLDMLKDVDRVIHPLRFQHARSGSPRVSAGEW